MKRTVVTWTLSLFFLFSFTACFAGDRQGSRLLQVSFFNGGKLFTAGRLKVVQLNGSYRQMGRQYGWLLRDDLNRLYEIAINSRFIGKQGFTHERLQVIAQSIFDVYPQRFKEIIYGMAETSGLGIDKQIVLNAIEWYPKINSFIPRCSGLAVWGDYTGGGPLVFGRNNDDSSFYKEFAEFMVVTVFNPNDSSIPAAIINYAGVMYAPTGISREGIFLELNSGNWTGYYPDRLSIFVTLFSFLQDFSSLSELDTAFQSTRVNLSSIINAADKTSACSYECPTFAVKRRGPDRDGLLAATNHFVDPSWELPPQPDDEGTEWTVTRRNNLLALAEKYKGAFDAEKVQEVLDTTIENGGATYPGGTIYQVVAVPEELKLWLKAPGLFEWQEVDLKDRKSTRKEERKQHSFSLNN
ncbi:MAG: C45 family autoproteolytic acyltransferase/hydrolase [Proteobacteria bacterium]|nr:C45 family autoproteolytic acyltransferase/hydrolase [Pseudomonadota bacterium]